MISSPLKYQLDPVVRRFRRVQLWRKLAVCWAIVALASLGFLVLQGQTGLASTLTQPVMAFLGIAAAIAVAVRQGRLKPDFRAIAQQIERRHPELRGLLLTAVEQQARNGGELGYLQYRLIKEAIDQGRQSDWRDTIPFSRLAWMHAAHGIALCAFVLTLWGLRVSVEKGAPALLSRSGVTVTPGDTRIERGNSLVVLARFVGPLPSDVALVLDQAAASPRQIPLVKSLADPMFGGSVPDVSGDFTYHIAYAGQRTRDFKVTVFEYPRLERADASLSFPEYTGQAPKRIEDTRRLSAVEGSRLDLTLQLNKPVASAQLVSKDKDKTVIPLMVATNRASAALDKFPLEASKTYELRLVDAEGRTNKMPAQFVFEVLPNRTPELRLAAPRGDVRPSALEEVSFEGTIWDDFGVRAYGLAYTLAGQESKFVELGRSVPGKERRAFHHLLRLEDLSALPDQLISWYVWADDIGPDGQVRRTSGDRFFAEVRPFEEIFREGQGMDGPSQQEQGEESRQGNQTTRLAELQKQIINATWKLQRENSQRPTPQYPKDAPVVRDSQAQALEQAESLKERATDPRSQVLWNDVKRQMEQALTHLNQATHSPAPLPKALAAEEAAYQALLKLRQREYEVSRSRSRNQRGNGGGEQQMQRQLDQLDLAQAENRYETQSQARPPQSPERREQLQVLNRLQELARRQQDLNDRLKELQTALQEARTDQEREEIRRRLKRLQEEEQQMLADMDEVRQRMERPENQSRMADERRQLDQTRQEVQRAAEAAGQGAASQALASGTRAQRQLQDLRDALRKESSNAFAEDMRQMRADARELARQQEEIEKKVDALAASQRKTLSDAPERKEAIDQLASQKGRLTNLVDRATQVSQQAEAAEPLLSKQLYDTLRKFSQEDAGGVKQFQEELLRRGLLNRGLFDRLQETADKEGAKSLEITAEMLRQGYLPQASQAEERARAGIGELKRGVERAAESVLGDDTEALRLARQELDRLTEQLEKEIAQAGSGGTTNGQSPAGSSGAGQRAGEPQAGRDQRAQAAGQGQPGSQGQTNASPGSPGQESPARTGNPQIASGQPGNGQNGRADQNADRPRGQRGEAAQNRGGAQTQAGRGAQSLRDPASRDPSARGERRTPAQAGGGGNERGGRFPADLDRMLDSGGGYGTGPIMGEDFAPWSDRLREVEEMIDFPELRNDVATARERARQMRVEFKRELKKPDWANVRLQVVKPLVEVRNRITEELARRESREALVPIDRDPVPNRYSELVRRYYEELGKDK